MSKYVDSGRGLIISAPGSTVPSAAPPLSVAQPATLAVEKEVDDEGIAGTDRPAAVG